MARRKQATPRRVIQKYGWHIERPPRKVKNYITLVRIKYATSPMVRRFGIGYVGLLTPDVLREPKRLYLD